MKRAQRPVSGQRRRTYGALRKAAPPPSTRHPRGRSPDRPDGGSWTNHRVRLDMDGPVAVVRMARGKANALDTAMCRDLAERLSEAEVTAHCLVGEDGLMHLPVMPPVAPMLAKSVKEIPRGALSYEPKWDGFRSVVFRDGDEVEIGSRNERPMTRYFPELVAAVLANLPVRCVIDGEIVIPNAEGDRLDFDALLQRVHPADSRVRLLAEQT